MIRTTLSEAEKRYIDLLKICLTRYGLEPEWQYTPYKAGGHPAMVTIKRLIERAIGTRGLRLVMPVRVDLDARLNGEDWPMVAETMVGLRRLDNLQDCIDMIERDAVVGDFIETGVWRGGASIFMRGMLAAHGDLTRRVWVADSFQGLPEPDPQQPPDAASELWRVPFLHVGLDEVKANFKKYDLLDDQVRFLPGWFKDTLPDAPISRLALIRLDGDLYESTIQALDALYPKLSPGGFVIVDDYEAIEGAKRAVHDFRSRHHIDDAIVPIDRMAVYWRRGS